MEETETPRILITGANGQLGTELAEALSARYGHENIILSDIVEKHLHTENLFYQLDVLQKDSLYQLIEEHKITQIYHLAAILSALGERNPVNAWRINMDGLLNVLEAAKEKKLDKVYWPSSIAAFGMSAPKDPTPQHTIMEPETVYGISKHTGELWCRYYWKKFGVDVRSLRYPGLVSYKALPGGGTTDYAVDIFYKALRGEDYTCYLLGNTTLPMMYMPDAIKATLELMDAPARSVRERTSYNVHAISFSPEELAAEIRRFYPSLKITFQPDFRQDIAESWPESIDDTAARDDWGWQHDYGLRKIVEDMIPNIEERIRAEKQDA